MSWIQELFETYNYAEAEIGAEKDDEVPLLPICHTTQMAQVEIVIDEKGDFRRARVVPKNEARTIIPCTESSGGRTSGVSPHPLCDKLQYIAADYPVFGGNKTHDFTTYASNLGKWCISEYSHPKIIAIFSYITKGRVIHDLVDHQVFLTGEDGKLIKNWEKKKNTEIPPIFTVLTSQDEAFVRWIVENPYELETRVWRDKSLWDCWARYYTSTKDQKSLCYVTGEESFIADQHPAKLRNDGDKAKLISANDSSGFTFRGRFLCSEQAAVVGFEVSQKAHYALRWLISRQGYRKGDLAIVAWAISGDPVPNPLDSMLSVLDSDDLVSDQPNTVSIAQELAIKFRKKIAGYRAKLGDTRGVVVLALDSATPGRMAIIYYQKLTGSDFLKRIDDWHDSCSWIHSYGTHFVKDDKSGKNKTVYITFQGAPTPLEIAEAAYGQKVDDKLKKATITRILPCIIEGRQIPYDLVESTYRRACNPIGMEKWEWNKTLSIACSLYRKYNSKENYDMTLDLSRKTRDYLYGRLLALAESLEEWALNEAREKRDTNAARLMQRFAERPFSTWRTIELALTPYKARLGDKSNKRQRMIDEVIASFNDQDFLSDKRLSGEFLLGYHCQRQYLRNSTSVENDTSEPVNL